MQSETSLLEERNFPKGYANINIRYVGVFENVKRAMLVTHYMFAHNNILLSQKIAGEIIIYNEIIKKVINWLVTVTSAA